VGGTRTPGLRAGGGSVNIATLRTVSLSGEPLNGHVLECGRVLAAGDPLTNPGPSAVLGATIRAVAAGNQDAFARLYGDYVRMVHAVLLGRIPRRDVDDLVQDVFLTAYTRIRELRDPSAFGGWIATIARNRATDYMRQTREQVALPDELAGGDPIETETLAVLEIVRALPEAYRETLLMRLVEGMSGAEIAERSGLTPASVRVNLHRGMKLLRERWADQGRPQQT
jgi:RNA polymerase sigma-70 factor (ECF subfamily)